ncbi:MAG TPA: hypothetical protein EYN67_09130 [Flavobacteriales bacterium]|nr:hypothetical protein [Flavobacteriales bacterium]
MARRKNVKRIDPRYFLHETVNRGEELEEGFMDKIKGVFGKKEEPALDPKSDEGRAAQAWKWLVKGGPTRGRFPLYYMKDSHEKAGKIYINTLQKHRAKADARRAKGETHRIPDEEEIHTLAWKEVNNWAKAEEKQARQRDPERKAKIDAKYEKESEDRAEEKRRRDGGRAKKYVPKNPSASQIAGAAMSGRWSRPAEE